MTSGVYLLVSFCNQIDVFILLLIFCVILVWVHCYFFCCVFLRLPGHMLSWACRLVKSRLIMEFVSKHIWIPPSLSYLLSVVIFNGELVIISHCLADCPFWMPVFLSVRQRWLVKFLLFPTRAERARHFIVICVFSGLFMLISCLAISDLLLVFLRASENINEVSLLVNF